MMNKSWWWHLHKYSYLVVKLGCLFLLLCMMIFSISIQFSVSSPFAVIPQHDDIESLIHKGDIENVSKCDLDNGDWVPHPAGPVYDNESCKWIGDQQNCMTNGRPDTGYLYWRWKPRGCELTQLIPVRFLELMRNKSWGFVGDSITRNHVQSFICILSKVEEAVEIYHDETFSCRKWLFPTYNVTISIIWSPFFVEAAIFEDMNGVSTSEIKLHLDKLDPKWTKDFKNFDYVMFSSGNWYVKTAIYYENNIILGCHSCPKQNLTELGFAFAYRKVLGKFFNYITDSNHKGMILFRTSTPDHFENGDLSDRGNCNRTKPLKEGEFALNEVVKILRNIELEEFNNATRRRSSSSSTEEEGLNFKLFDVSRLSLSRPDGHPGPYRFFQPFAKDKNTKIINDCLHWCMPGPIDAWSDVLMEMVVR